MQRLAFFPDQLIRLASTTSIFLLDWLRCMLAYVHRSRKKSAAGLHVNSLIFIGLPRFLVRHKFQMEEGQHYKMSRELSRKIWAWLLRYETRDSYCKSPQQSQETCKSVLLLIAMRFLSFLQKLQPYWCTRRTRTWKGPFALITFWPFWDILGLP